MNLEESSSTLSPSNPNSKSTWIFFLPFGYFLIWVVSGIFLLGKGIHGFESIDSGQTFFFSVFKLMISSFIFFILGLLGLFLVTIYTLYRLIRNHSFFLAIQRHWPLLLAIIYLFIPNLPGPIDDFVVSSLLSALAVYFGISKKEKNPKEIPD